MNSYFYDFMSQPLWFTIPLVAIYLVLVVYVIYIIWRFKKWK